jgi:TetR/AcrR family transcriptional regulator
VAGTIGGTKKGAHEPEGARERLLAAALLLFNEKGYAASSVREIVQVAGVTKPVLYYYFGSKEGIYLELMESSYRIFESITATISSLDGSADEKIIQFCSDLFDASVAKLPLVRLIYAIYYGPPQGAPHFDLDVYTIRLIEVIQQMVTEGIASGQLKDKDAGDTARAVFAILTATVNEQLSPRANKPDRETLVRMLTLLMSGITRHKELDD